MPSSPGATWSVGRLFVGQLSDESLICGGSALAPLVTGDLRLVERNHLASTLGLHAGGSTDDRSLIAAAWNRWGADCPAHLTGDFSFVLWDPRSHSIFAACDPLGVKPLFYDFHAPLFVAAGSLAELLECHPDPPDGDDISIATYLSRPFARAGWTSLRRRITLLPPGHSLTVTRAGCVTRRYCRLEEAPEIRFSRASEYEEALLHHLTQAVQDAVGPDERVGVHLSGGLDSSAIAVLASQAQAQRAPLPAYCWQPPAGLAGTEAPDQALVRTVARHAHLALRPAELTADDLLASLALDPFQHSVTSTLSLEAPVHRAARGDGVTVLLSGWGGDECVSFRGYDPADVFPSRLLPAHLVRRCLGLCDPGPQGVADVLRRRFDPRLRGPKPVSRAAYATSYLTPAYLERWKSRTVPPGTYSTARSAQIGQLTHGHLAERMASWSWAAAQSGLEYRYPMLDIRLIRFVLGMPPEIYRPGPLGRRFARRSFSRILPESVLRYTDKTDPTRTNANLLITADVLARVLPQLGTANPDRARHFDLQRLAADIEHLISTGQGPVGLIMRSLAFLNLALPHPEKTAL